MGDTKIEWADKVWNPVTGCTPVSGGCRNCYAERMSRRFYKGWNPRGHFEVRFHPDRLDQPLRWRKPRRVFVCSMGDLFHEDVKEDWIDKVIGTIILRPQHTFMVPTKRPERMRQYMNGDNYDRRTWPPKNLWLGVSVEDQRTADERIPILLQTPAALRFVSVEPMLGQINLREMAHQDDWHVDALDTPDPSRSIKWVICGGESGPGARPMHPDWARSLRDQCQAAGVPFFFKQWGEWAAVEAYCGPRSKMHKWSNPVGEEPLMARVGKKAAGRLLDGRVWAEFPEVKG